MADIHIAMRRAFRERLLGVTKATTGAQTTLAATATGYSRTTGSFLADDFSIGDEVRASGFATANANGIGIVTAVATSTLAVAKSPHSSAAAGAPVTIVAGLPNAVAWEDRPITPLITIPWVRERMTPVSSTVRGAGYGGYIEHLIMFEAALFYPARLNNLLALELMAAAVRERFAPGTGLVNSALTGRVTQAYRSSVLTEPDWQQITVTINVQAHTANLPA